VVKRFAHRHITMKYWLTGKRAGLIVFIAITALVAGGLGWVTSAALRLEHEQLEARAESEVANQLRVALWRLDSQVLPILAREESRPYEHYSSIYASPSALKSDGSHWPSGTVLEPSPLVNAELPDWMLVHFQADENRWWSPEIPSEAVRRRLAKAGVQLPETTLTAERGRLLADLSAHLSAANLLARVEQFRDQPGLAGTTLVPSPNALALQNSPPAQAAKSRLDVEAQPVRQGKDSEYYNRAERVGQLRQQANTMSQNESSKLPVGPDPRNGDEWPQRLSKGVLSSEQVAVTLGPLIPVWVKASSQEELLIAARPVQIGSRKVCQGILLDWPRLRTALQNEVSDLFDAPRLMRVHESPPPHPERAMAALPVELDPGPMPLARPPEAEWTPLRVGLALAWAALFVALAAVGLGGWSLLDLSERRIRFVSAVTHELRTPLTTLRLYLDMLAGGMVKEESKKEEYLQTLNTEADRLNRLVSNVLDFSRLENQRPRLAKTEVVLGELLEQVRADWAGRCQSADKDLVVENSAGSDLRLVTDVQIVRQILGNLIDNACKYSRGAADRRIWLRARREDQGRLVFEVEVCGPGVAPGDRQSIFRPFRRGKQSDMTIGGAGLGLALAQRWTRLLGGRLALQRATKGTGACFWVELPATVAPASRNAR
jgi:signal transduction histidine kinase